MHRFKADEGYLVGTMCKGFPFGAILDIPGSRLAREKRGMIHPATFPQRECQSLAKPARFGHHFRRPASAPQALGDKWPRAPRQKSKSSHAARTEDPIDDRAESMSPLPKKSVFRLSVSGLRRGGRRHAVV